MYHDVRSILTINSGSSSIKFALFHIDANETCLLRGSLERIGLSDGHFSLFFSEGEADRRVSVLLPDHQRALSFLFDSLGKTETCGDVDAVGHRIVHGGRYFYNPCRITSEVIDTLRDLIPLAGEHLPHEITAIEMVKEAKPGIPQVACFDTAFHRSMPEVTQRYPLPRRLYEKGVTRYGFHGLSYEFILSEIRRIFGATAARSRIIIAHLGNGSSMAALKDGKSIETTMGLTPLGGLMMGTRPGDLDPGVLLHLLREPGMDPEKLSDLLHKRSGLLGISGISADMQDLLEAEADHPEASEAIECYCYQARKSLGGLMAALGGLDWLIFTGGIGEQAPSIRHRICEGLETLGIRLDPEANQANRFRINSLSSSTQVRVLTTNEELMVARHTRQVIHCRDREALDLSPAVR